MHTSLLYPPPPALVPSIPTDRPPKQGENTLVSVTVPHPSRTLHPRTAARPLPTQRVSQTQGGWHTGIPFSPAPQPPLNLCSSSPPFFLQPVPPPLCPTILLPFSCRFHTHPDPAAWPPLRESPCCWHPATLTPSKPHRSPPSPPASSTALLPWELPARAGSSAHTPPPNPYLSSRCLPGTEICFAPTAGLALPGNVLLEGPKKQKQNSRLQNSESSSRPGRWAPQPRLSKDASWHASPCHLVTRSLCQRQHRELQSRRSPCPTISRSSAAGTLCQTTVSHNWFTGCCFSDLEAPG